MAAGVCHSLSHSPIYSESLLFFIIVILYDYSIRAIGCKLTALIECTYLDLLLHFHDVLVLQAAVKVQ